jgi:hypothetical protein
VIEQAHKGIERVRRTPQLASSFLRHAGLSPDKLLRKGVLGLS